jgi:hypothetical protein
MSLAGVLADSRAKTTSNEVERLLSKCPDIPLIPIDDININIPGQQLNVGRMVNYIVAKKLNDQSNTLRFRHIVINKLWML